MKSNLSKSIFLASIIIFSAVFFSGCWNRRETNTMAIAGAVAFDFEDGKHKLTFEIIKPRRVGTSKGEGSDEKPVVYVQSTGYSAFEATRDATTKFDRKIFMPDIRTYIFSEKAARKGLVGYYDFLTRDHETRLGIPIFIAKDTAAANILGNVTGIAKVSSDYIKNIAVLSKSNSKSMNVYLKDFLVEYYEEGIEPITGVLQRKKSSEPQLEKSSYELSDEGSAVFLQDKLVGFLDGEETRAVSLIKGKIKSGVITSSSSEGGFNSVEIIKVKSKNSVSLKEDTPVITVNIDLDTTMLSEITSEKEIDGEKIEEIEKATSETVKKEIEETIKKVQNEYKSDVFGFGKIIHQKNPDEWKKVKSNWNTLFADAVVKVNVSSAIRRHGLTDVPLKNKGAK